MCGYQFLLLLFAGWIALSNEISDGSSELPSNGPTNTTQALTTPAVTTPALPARQACYYSDSRVIIRRRNYCHLRSSCFSYIYRGEEGVRTKRGCSYLCKNETRGKKVQRCCTGHLCNDHVLSEADFSEADFPEDTPPPQCYQSRSNTTCNMTTACYSRLTYQSDGSYLRRQGCIRGRTCNQSEEGNRLQTCCTTHLCNEPLPLSSHSSVTTPTFISTQQMPTQSSETPPTTSTFTPPNIKPDGPSDNSSPTPITDHTSLLNCHCDLCERDDTCQGFMCAYLLYESSPAVAMMTNRLCLNDTSVCSTHSWDAYPGASVVCCNSDWCNIMLPRSTPPTTPPGETTHPPQTSTYHTADTSPTSLVSTTTRPLLELSDQYFTIAAVGSVLGGVIVVGIILSAIVVLIVNHQRKNKAIGKSSISPRQPSPDCHMPVCYSKTTRGSPCITSSSRSSFQMEDTLKYLGTSV